MFSAPASCKGMLGVRMLTLPLRSIVNAAVLAVVLTCIGRLITKEPVAVVVPRIISRAGLAILI